MSKLSNVLHGQYEPGFQVHEGGVNVHKAAAEKGVGKGGQGSNHLAKSIGPAPNPIIKDAEGDTDSPTHEKMESKAERRREGE